MRSLPVIPQCCRVLDSDWSEVYGHAPVLKVQGPDDTQVTRDRLRGCLRFKRLHSFIHLHVRARTYNTDECDISNSHQTENLNNNNNNKKVSPNVKNVQNVLQLPREQFRKCSQIMNIY